MLEIIDRFSNASSMEGGGGRRREETVICYGIVSLTWRVVQWSGKGALENFKGGARE